MVPAHERTDSALAARRVCARVRVRMHVLFGGTVADGAPAALAVAARATPRHGARILESRALRRRRLRAFRREPEPESERQRRRLCYRDPTVIIFDRLWLWPVRRGRRVRQPPAHGRLPSALRQAGLILFLSSPFVLFAAFVS